MFLDTPVFPQWRAWLAAVKRTAANLRSQSPHELEILFASLLPGHLLAPAPKGLNSRQRIFTLRRTFFGFLSQVLTPNTSCREITNQFRSLLELDQSGTLDAGDSAYCQARARLPLETLQAVLAATAQAAERRCPAERLWLGHPIKVVDGTTILLPDTPANQADYPQSSAQAPGCGFPWLRLVGVFSLSTGPLLALATGNKHDHELTLFRPLEQKLEAGDVVVTDRNFGDYATIARLLAAGVYVVARLHHGRRVDFRQGRRLGKDDRLVVWHKPKTKPDTLSPEQWAALPEDLTVRLVRVRVEVRGFRTEWVVLATTLLDTHKYPAAELGWLFRRRWQVELRFRDIKTAMKMEMLRCKTPAMVQRELLMFMIAYNLIRCLMLAAATGGGVPLERISFKGSVDAVRQYAGRIAKARGNKGQQRMLRALLRLMAEDLVRDRPNRVEPRAVKRRPKPYALLNKPRRQFKEIPHRSRYWKNNPRKTKR
ncbi:MAG: IS4 family transposase [Planctomycetes bacterium]|nr:IS4 family transposase [Planctomycetota bacterium]